MNNETPLAAIQKQLGLADLKTTQNYLGSFEQSKVAEYESDLLDKTKTTWIICNLSSYMLYLYIDTKH